MDKIEKQSPDPASTTPKSNQIEIGGHVGSFHMLAGDSSRYELRIDREGRWFHEGIEIVREDIRNYFSRHLVQDEDGGYSIRIGQDECPVIVEDAPFIVARVTEDPGGTLTLLLNDGYEAKLDPNTLEFRCSNVPYCCIRDGLRARFSRPAYYQLARFIKYDEERDQFHLVFDGTIRDLNIAEEE
jgi:hypothetical protein